jgi:hypothetical protein
MHSGFVTAEESLFKTAATIELGLIALISCMAIRSTASNAH